MQVDFLKQDNKKKGKNKTQNPPLCVSLGQAYEKERERNYQGQIAKNNKESKTFFSHFSPLNALGQHPQNPTKNSKHFKKNQEQE